MTQFMPRRVCSLPSVLPPILFCIILEGKKVVGQKTQDIRGGVPWWPSGWESGIVAAVVQVTAVAQVGSLAPELPQAKKRKKETEKHKGKLPKKQS